MNNHTMWMDDHSVPIDLEQSNQGVCLSSIYVMFIGVPTFLTWNRNETNRCRYRSLQLII